MHGLCTAYNVDTFQGTAKLNMSEGFASAFSGGVWWDPQAAVYKMWYRCGNAQCLALSNDTVNWTKPVLPTSPVNGTNVVDASKLDGSTVWLDLREGVNVSERCVAHL
jgi:hypothetical protein